MISAASGRRMALTLLLKLYNVFKSSTALDAESRHQLPTTQLP